MYLYETHLHTAPLSACAVAGVRETLEFYKSVGYQGVFMTDHFIDGNISEALDDMSYDERIEAFFKVYEDAKPIADEIGIDIFSAFEMSYKGTDFLVYGISKEWCLAHPDMDKMAKTKLLRLMMDDGALLIQAHPFREARYIDHIRLFPRHVHGAEVFNACRTDFENMLAGQYCQNYDLIPFSGSDNHVGAKIHRLGGMASDRPVKDVRDFIDLVLSGEAKPFMKMDGEIVLV